MAKTRSPGYPAIGLKDAIERAERIYNSDYQNPLPRDVAATHMGYQSLNGKSLGVLSALVKFGLLEGRGDGTRVTDLAVKIIAHPSGTKERSEAVVEAASLPELFAELDGRFQGGRASDQALRSYLLTQKFIPSAADAAIRAYRDTKSLVQSEASSYDSVHSEDSQMEAAAVEVQRPTVQQVFPEGRGMSLPNLTVVEPYRVSFTPNGVLEVAARLTSVDDAEAFRDDIDGFIEVLRKRDAREKKRAQSISDFAKVAYAPMKEPDE